MADERTSVAMPAFLLTLRSKLTEAQISTISNKKNNASVMIKAINKNTAPTISAEDKRTMLKAADISVVPSTKAIALGIKKMTVKKLVVDFRIKNSFFSS